MNKEKESQTLTKFIGIYCQKNHNGPRIKYGMTQEICAECESLLTYAKRRLELCPYNPKPKCRDCKTHCYASLYRERIKKVMQFSGIYMVKRGRLDYLFGYFMK